MDAGAPGGQTERVEERALPSFVIDVERDRAALRVTARTPDGSPGVCAEAVFSGGADRMWLRLTRGGRARVFEHAEVARHPALSAVLRLIADEVDLARPERDALLAFLFGSLLIYTDRMSIAVPLPRWGRPLRNSRIERALELLNQDISRRWTVEQVARAVGLSRPVFAREFQRVLGLSPMRYLTERRLRVAAALLLESEATLADVAGRVGYGSEFAFNRAFRRHYGVPPGLYRQRPPGTLCAAYAVAA